MYPNLSQLLLPTGTYPDSNLPWDEREELVVGGCKPHVDFPNATKCYDDWTAAFLARVLENDQANTLLLLSTGAGVMELRALKTILDDLQATHIDQVWLVDPGVTQHEADQVVAGYLGRLQANVQVRYFSGYGAVARAEQDLHNDASRVVAAIGSLNHSFDDENEPWAAMRDDRDVIIALQKRFYQPLVLVRTAEARNPNVHIVRAHYNSAQGHVVRDQTLMEFWRAHVDHYGWALRIERRFREQYGANSAEEIARRQLEQGNRAQQREDDRPVDQPPTCLIN